MDGAPDDVELLLASARQEIAALQEDPRLKARNGNRGAGLREHVLDLIGASELRLSRVPAPGAPVDICQAFARSIRESILVLRAAHRSLPWLAATQSPNVNLGSLYMTEEYAELLVGADVDLVVVPDIQFMYSTVSWPFSTVIDKTKGFKAKTTRRPIILNYPLSDSDRLLLHPLFAHELGHAAVDRYEFVRILEQELLQEADFVKALDQATSAMHKFWPASSPARIRRTLRAWLRAWTKEVMCDHLALEAAGPPFLWAMGGFVLPQRYSEPSHPPNTLRTKLALEHLDGNGWRQVMEEFAPKVTGWLDGVGADATEPLLPPFDFLRDQFLRRSDLWQDAARKRAAGGGLRPDPAVSQAKEAADLLDKLILPVGLDQPLLRRAILLGGWRDAFQRHGDSPQGLVDALADRRLQDLVGKAIEMTTVVASWSPP